VTEQISSHLVNQSNHIPIDFARRPRALKDIDRWKALKWKMVLQVSEETIFFFRNKHVTFYENFCS
jgi:hypothetical protein